MRQSILLPGHIADEYLGPEHAIQSVIVFRDKLKAISDLLDVIWVKDGARNFEHPGRWHIVVLHPGGNDELNTYFVVQNPDGSYCEPDDRHLEAMRKRNVANRRDEIYREHCAARDAKKARVAKLKAERREWFRESLNERLAHIHDTQVSVPKDVT